MRHIQPEIGESLVIFFKTLILLYLFHLFFYLWLTVSKRVSKAILLDNKFKSVRLWDSYGLKQGNPLQILKLSSQIIFFLSPDLLFYLMYQNGYQRWYILRINECVGLWVRYILKEGNMLYFFQNANPIIFFTFIYLFFNLLYQRGCQRLDLLEIKWKKRRPMMQLRPETDESLAIFQNTDPILFVLFISIFLTY